MKTNQLIDMLGAGDPAPAGRTRARAWPLLAAVSLSAAALVFSFGVRPDLVEAMALPAFWIKLAFCLALAGAGWVALKRLATPGANCAVLPWLIGVPILLMWCQAALLLAQAGPEEQGALFWGSTWRYCPILITAMALPVLAAALYVMRGLAPTRLRLAGAAAGLSAGAMAAVAYCLHCPEMSAVFVGFWYLLGMLIPATLGALLGPRVLRW